MVVLNTTYFGSVEWYAQLARATEPVYIEAHESFVKQTERSRCRIATANGVQMLSVPVNAPSRCSVRDVAVTDHANWRRQHWNALCSAYGESPFFDYYADDIRPFFEPEWNNLFDLNMAITRRICELLDIHPDIRLTDHYVLGEKLRQSKGEQPQINVRSYYQVFQRRHGFLPNLSMLDLLFNEGNEAILKLHY